MEEVGKLESAVKNKRDANDLQRNDSSNPVVYQLVRVEGDGTLVPATEDEVLHFEHLFHGEKGDLYSMEDVGHVEDLFTNDAVPPEKSDPEVVLSQLETTDIQTRKLDAGLEECRSQQLEKSLDLASKCTTIHGQPPDGLNTELVHSNFTQQDNTSMGTANSTALNDSCSAGKQKGIACSKSVNDAAGTGLSITGTTSSVPDFSLLKGQVCLDNLTIRELQEAFRATFGRQTTVKDKLWLKRRITMGLTNSCDIPSLGCVVKDYEIVCKDAKQEMPSLKVISKVDPEANPLVRHLVIEPGNDRDSPSISYYHSEDQHGSSKRLRRTPLENDRPKETLLNKQCTTKRMRKPTKRYVEELSDIEAQDSNGKITSPTKMPGHAPALLKPQAAPFHEMGSWSSTFPTRNDTLGGFSVHVPYVSRMRRGRPRQNFIFFLQDHNPSVESTKVPTKIEMTMEKDGENLSRIRKARSIYGRTTPLMHVNKKVEYIETIDDKEDIRGPQISEENVDSSADAKPKIKGGGKRKHHRAWTLCEVLKLVDGVAQYGAGRWSEIRRLAFASYSYRTSVDLKDKWRNLIRASLAQLAMDNDGDCARKSASTLPIPPSILLRVRELAELHSQKDNFITVPIKLTGHNRKVVQGKGSGFL